MNDLSPVTMPKDVAADYKFGMRFFDHARHIIGPHLLDTTPMLLDVTEASDLLVIGGRDKRIAYRVRRDSGRCTQWANEFTVRSGRLAADGSGRAVKTELEKIISGSADWMLYGWGDEETERLTTWHLIDLDVFRNLYALHSYTQATAKSHIKNPDGRTTFVAFDLRQMPRDILIDSSIPELLSRPPSIDEINAGICGIR